MKAFTEYVKIATINYNKAISVRYAKRLIVKIQMKTSFSVMSVKIGFMRPVMALIQRD